MQKILFAMATLIFISNPGYGESTAPICSSDSTHFLKAFSQFNFENAELNHQILILRQQQTINFNRIRLLRQKQMDLWETFLLQLMTRLKKIKISTENLREANKQIRDYFLSEAPVSDWSGYMRSTLSRLHQATQLELPLDYITTLITSDAISFSLKLRILKNLLSCS